LCHSSPWLIVNVKQVETEFLVTADYFASVSTYCWIVVGLFRTRYSYLYLYLSHAPHDFRFFNNFYLPFVSNKYRWQHVPPPASNIVAWPCSMSNRNSCALCWRRCWQRRRLRQRCGSDNKSESFHVTHYAGGRERQVGSESEREDSMTLITSEEGIISEVSVTLLSY